MKKLFTKISAIALALTLTASTSSGMTNISINNGSQKSISFTAAAASNAPSYVTITKSKEYYAAGAFNLNNVVLENAQGYQLRFNPSGDLYIYNSRKSTITKYLARRSQARSDRFNYYSLVFQGDGNLVCYGDQAKYGLTKPLYHSNSYQPSGKLIFDGYKYTYLLLADTLYIERIAPNGKIDIIFNSKINSFAYC